MTDYYRNIVRNNWIKIAKYCRDNYAGKLDEKFGFTWGYYADDPTCVSYSISILPTGEIYTGVAYGYGWHFPKYSIPYCFVDEDGFLFTGYGDKAKIENRDYGETKIYEGEDVLESFISKWPEIKATIEKEIRRQAQMCSFQP